MGKPNSHKLGLEGKMHEWELLLCRQRVITGSREEEKAFDLFYGYNNIFACGTPYSHTVDIEICARECEQAPHWNSMAALHKSDNLGS